MHHFADAEQMAAHLSRAVESLARGCIDRRGRFIIALAGGSTPRALYTLLRHIDTAWGAWHVYFGDERCLPLGHPERNDSMIAAALLDHVAIPREQVHQVPFADGAGTAAKAYARVAAAAPLFDLVLLGLGEDGHTASLFPGLVPPAAGPEAAIPVLAAPKPPAQRVSLSPRRLSQAGAVWFLVSGEDKRAALDAWLSGVELPASLIRPAAGVDIFTDLAEV